MVDRTQPQETVGTPRRARPVDVAFPPFRPRLPWLSGDLQTVRNAFLDSVGLAPRGPSPDNAQTLQFGMTDGTEDVLIGRLDEAPSEYEHPLVLLVHGLTGCQDSVYMRATAQHLVAQGYSTLRLNLRGAGPSRSRCRFWYHAGRSDDLATVIQKLDPTLTEQGLIVIGFSLGGNILLKYLGERGEAAPVLAAATVSAPIDLAATSRCMMELRNSRYHRWLLDRMRTEATAPGADVTDEERRAVAAARTVYEFDDTFVAPRNGFGTADRYYAGCSGRRFLGDIRVPTLLIHAADDPWIPIEPYRSFSWRDNDMLVPLLADHGGHLGFHGRNGPPPWHDQCISLFLKAAVG